MGGIGCQWLIHWFRLCKITSFFLDIDNSTLKNGDFGVKIRQLLGCNDKSFAYL